MNTHIQSDADQIVENLTHIYKALTHPVRLQLLRVLVQQEACVCHLTALTRRPQPYISQQLGVLREAGLVADRRDGQIIYYRIAHPLVASLLAGGLEVLRCQGGPADLPPVTPGRIPGCPCPRCAPSAD
jgi:DNA-binding transcriptional ArsR family regulator